jgi:hypothetical protein
LRAPPSGIDWFALPQKGFRLQDRFTHKTSTILIATGPKLRSFRSLTEVPEPTRTLLIQSTSGPYSATLLIADEAGRREVLRSLQGQPSAVQSRWIRSFAGRTSTVASANSPGPSLTSPVLSAVAARWRRTAEIALLTGIGLCLWLLAAWK